MSNNKYKYYFTEEKVYSDYETIANKFDEGNLPHYGDKPQPMFSRGSRFFNRGNWNSNQDYLRRMVINAIGCGPHLDVFDFVERFDHDGRTDVPSYAPDYMIVSYLYREDTNYVTIVFSDHKLALVNTVYMEWHKGRGQLSRLQNGDRVMGLSDYINLCNFATWFIDPKEWFNPMDSMP